MRVLNTSAVQRCQQATPPHLPHLHATPPCPLRSLGREVCGFPRIVHGGLTAAIIDESFGGLLFALKKQRALPFW